MGRGKGSVGCVRGERRTCGRRAGVWRCARASGGRHSGALGLPSLFRDQRARDSSSGWYDAPPGAVDMTPAMTAP